MSECKKCGNKDNYNFALNIGLCNSCIVAELEQLQAENERRKEWKKAVLGKIKRWPIYDAGKWAGDKEGWGYIFELIGWSEQERTKLQAKNEKLKSTIEQAIETMGSAPVQGNGKWETGMFCGLEDRTIEDRYVACRYGYDNALEKVQEWIIDELEQALKDNQ